MKAKDIMTTAVVAIRSDASAEEAVHLMLEKHVSALPVLDADGHLAGLVSEGDLMRRVREPESTRRSWWLEIAGAGSTEDFLKARSRHVADLMTRQVVTIEEGTPVGEIARLLEKHRIKRAPVLRDGRVVGIVSRANLLHALSALGDEGRAEPLEDDRVLRDRIHDALAQVPGAPVNLINTTVDQGNVSVWGVADSDSQESAVRVAIENIPGVRSVDVHLGRLPAWAYGI